MSKSPEVNWYTVRDELRNFLRSEDCLEIARMMAAVL